MLDESFLRLYLKYTSKQESPDDFHLWVGMTMVAAALGRKCFINGGTTGCSRTYSPSSSRARPGAASRQRST